MLLSKNQNALEKQLVAHSGISRKAWKLPIGILIASNSTCVKVVPRAT
jgi:hypothetical protein